MTLLAFDRPNFVLKGVFSNFSIELGGKIAHVDVEVVNAVLDYNLLLGRSQFYAMTAVVSSIFCLLYFPHGGKFVTTDQTDLCMSSAHISTMQNFVPLVGDHPGQYQIVGTGLFKSSSLMGVFPQLPLPITPTSSKAPMHMISSDTYGPYRPLNPQVVSPVIMEVDQGSEHTLPPILEEIASLAIPSVPPDTIKKLHHNMEYDQDPLPTWATPLFVPRDSFDDESSSLQVMLEVMNTPIDHHGDITPLPASSLPSVKHVELGIQNLEVT